MSMKKIALFLTGAERQSGHDRQKQAEALIKQLPEDHDGRNTWLLNYGVSEEAKARRASRGIQWMPNQCAAKVVSGPGV